MSEGAAFPDPARTRAVLIGTDRYTHLEDLPAVGRNLTDLAGELTGPYSWGLSPRNCTVVSSPATAAAATDALVDAATAATDSLFVYYAGHGLVDRQGGLYLGLAGTLPDRPDTGLVYEWIRQYTLDSRAGRRVVILDCCFGGRALGAMDADQQMAVSAEIEGSYVLAAAGENATALAEPGEEHTAFTGTLLRLLREGVPGGPPVLDLDCLYRELHTALRADSRPLPHKRDRNTAGRLALAHNRAVHPAATPGHNRPPDRAPSPDRPRPARGPHPARQPGGGPWRRRTTRKTLALGLAATTFAATAVVLALVRDEGSADDPTQLRCADWPHRDVDTTQGGFTGSGRMKEGPYTACDSVTWVSQGMEFDYACHVVNGYGNRWTYGRIAGSDDWGWISADFLDDRGSRIPCADAASTASGPGRPHP